MQKNKFEDLYNTAICALNYGTLDEKRAIFEKIVENSNYNDRQIALNNAKKYIPMSVEINYKLIPDNLVTANLYGYSKMLENKIHAQKYRVSSATINFLKSNQNNFTPETLLYQQQNNTLTVSNMLKVINYSLDITQAIFGINNDKYKQGILALRGLEKILNNQTETNNALDNLSYAIEIFIQVAKHLSNTNEKHGQFTSISIFLNLAIDFLQFNK